MQIQNVKQNFKNQFKALKILFDEEKTLNYLIEEERMEFPVRNKLFGTASTIYNVEALSDRYKKNIDPNKKSITFTPLASQLFFGIFGLFIFLGIFFFNGKGKEEFKLFFFFFWLIAIAAFLYKVLSKKLNYKIAISELGILVNNMFYSWTEVCKIYIVERPAGNGSNWYLIIALDTELIERYDISNITGFIPIETKLAAYIVHYKNFA